ncbi:MAG: hypothetical protein O7E57_00765 [Gammaproteobacteria bacterium]|nr:hypothetical protein [Gammaproteobacteria bacterium]
MIFESEPCSDALMVLAELQAHLEKNFSPHATEGLDATFCLAMAKERLTFRIREQALEFTTLESRSCDATFHFEGVEDAAALLSGQQDVLKSFMSGQFRADGYLMWAFLLIAIFRNTTHHRSP